MSSVPLRLERLDRRLEGIARFVRFAAIGVSGLLVNEGVVWLLAMARVDNIAAAIAGAELASAWNFVWTERLVFHARGEGRRKRFAWFMIMNSAWLGLQVPVLFTLTEWAGLHLPDANLIAIIAATAGRFIIADRAIWRDRKGGATLHGRIEPGLRHHRA